MARLFLVLLSLVAAFAGVAHLHASGAEQVQVVEEYAEARLSAAASGFPLAAKDDRALAIARVVAKRTSFQFALGDVAARGERPDSALLEQARLSVSSLAGEDHPVVVVGTTGGVRGVRSEGEVTLAKGELPPVAEALAGGEAHGFAAVEGRLHRMLAVPVSTGALAVALPVDDAFATAVARTLGVDVTFVQGDKAVASSLPTMERGDLVVKAAGAGAGIFGAGARPANYTLAEALDLPLFGNWPGTTRAIAVPLPGDAGASVIYSVPVRGVLDPFVEAQKRTILLAGLTTALGLFLATIGGGGGRRRKAILRQLADVGERAAEGDASAQAPEALPGDLGRLARAINRLSHHNRLNRKLEPEAVPPMADGAVPPLADAAVPPLPSFGDEPREPGFGADGVPDGAEDEPETEFPAEPTQRDAPLPFGGIGALFDDTPQEPAPPAPSAEQPAREIQPGGDLPFATEPAPGGPPVLSAEEPAHETQPGDLPFALDHPDEEREAGGASASDTTPPGFAAGAAPWDAPSDAAGGSSADAPPGFAAGASPWVGEGSSEGEHAPVELPAASPQAESPALGAAPADEPAPPAAQAGPSWDQPTRPLPSFAASADAAAGGAGDATTRLPQELVERLAREQVAAKEAAARAAEARAAEEPEEDPEEAHLREVFERFLQVRQECGESSAGIQYERFATKLRANRAQLVEKYRCSTVRFTVYVKDGKAALKATPIR